MPVLKRANIACEAALECKLADHKLNQKRRRAEHECLWHPARQIIGLVMRSLFANGLPDYKQVAFDWFVADYTLALNHQPGSFLYFNLEHGPVNTRFPYRIASDGVMHRSLLLATRQTVKRPDGWIVPQIIPSGAVVGFLQMAMAFYYATDRCVAEKMRIDPY